MKQKLPFAVVHPIACEVIEKLRPYCAQIEIAGSLRRQRPEIGDIEIVAQPLEYVPDLLGEPTETHSLDLYAWADLGVMGKGGHKYKQIWLDGSNIQLDLFIVTPPAQWGVIFLQRTGNDEFSHKFVTSKQYGGMKPACYSIRDGAVWSGTTLIETPTERELFNLFGVKYIPPIERQYE